MNRHPIQEYLEFSKAKRTIDRLWFYAIPALLLIFFIGFFYLIWNLLYLTDQYAREIALRDAIRFQNAINEFRDYYSTAVVANLRDSDIEFTHDYHYKENAIPLPATLTRELGQNISKSNASSMAFYSDYPFPWHAGDAVESDPFMLDALTYLRQNPDEVYYRFESRNDSDNEQSVLRYASPSIMGESCVACHNNHPDSPRSDWEVGDVRGILEVSVPITYVSIFNIDAPSSRLILSGLMLLVGAAGLSITGYQLRSFTFRAIEDRAIKLENEIAERELAEAKLNLAIEEAQNANIAKSRFLATMSHELRTPLNAIIGYSELLEEDASDNGAVDLKCDLNRISRSGRHLLSMINDILDLSKIEAGKMDFEKDHIEIFRITQYIEDVTLLLFDQSTTSFQLNIAPDVQTIYTDETRLRQILFNLLSNAAKFTEQGVVKLDIQPIVFENENYIELKVADTGIGMSQNVVKSIFNPFEQGDSGTSRKYGGTGLGLSITRSLVHLLDGEISVKTLEGGGSMFVVLLPCNDRIII
ncbi:MAG: ATP-binding protein [Anaerolineae bacterium]